MRKETDETLPDIRQFKQMALLYNVSLDELIEFDVDVKEIQQIIDRTSEELEEKIDWTNAWGKKYHYTPRQLICQCCGMPLSEDRCIQLASYLSQLKHWK